MSPTATNNSQLDSIVSLAEDISKLARSLKAASARPRTPPPTSPDSTTPPDECHVLDMARLRKSCDELLFLAVGPHEHLMAMAQHHRAEAALQLVTHFELASLVPKGEGATISYEELAAKVNLPTHRVSRPIRLLATYHVFSEPAAGFVAHNEVSRLLLEEELHATVSYYTEESFRSASYLAPAVERWPDAQERNETALNLAYDTRLPKFDFFDSEPWRAAKFRKAMAGMTRGDRFALQHLIDAFDWGSLQSGSVVADVGGGGGHCSVALAEANPQLRCVVQDLKTAFQGQSLPQRVQSRIRFMEHDFFSPQPLEADIYLLRWILHDYPDKVACRILRNITESMRPGARILIMEGIMVPPGQRTRLEERKSRLLDMAMMILLNSRERSLSDWISLFHDSDPSLELVKVTKPEGSALSLMELRRKSNDEN
ncbi:sterigmatocystin 8-O-methyltransferase [Apiospora arundinis]